MKKLILSTVICLWTLASYGQISPAITSWLQNTSATGSYYVQGNATLIDNDLLVNCQKVEYSEDFVYITTQGIPAYPTGPFLDGNPSQATEQDAIYKLPLVPEENTGTPTETPLGNIGVFVNGVSLFDWKDGVAWNSNTMALCGGPGNPPCPGGPAASTDWNRDAIPAERDGFDCSKGHPAMGNYHHHQNPSAFKLDQNVVSEICNLYDAEGLYAIDESSHSPLIGFAYDGFPIYGAYAYANTDGSGDIVRIKSSYQLRNITERTTHADGTSVDQGPPTDGDYPLGYFREDYEFIAHPGENDYLDEHNGRFCVTPDYPDGTYAYFATVDENWNSTFPYVIGPTFYGVYANRKVNNITETTTVYDIVNAISESTFESLNFTVFPNPANEFIAVQLHSIATMDFDMSMYDMTGIEVATSTIKKGSTIAYFDIQRMYSGTYYIKIQAGEQQINKKVVIIR